MKIIFTLLFIATISSIAFAKKRLRCFDLPDDNHVVTTPSTQPPTTISSTCQNAHEIYSDCGANGCQNTCDNPLLSTYCKAMCIPGCICENGYIRDSNNNCILPQDCPISTTVAPTTISSTCPKAHEIYTDCGSLCAKTCENKDKTVMCPMVCVTGCFCEAGYVRNDNGDCILAEQCPAIEPPPTCSKAHEVYTDCGTACPLTCDNKDSQQICTMQCVAGCFCEAGYVRDNNGDCILPEKCPKSQPVCSGTHEKFNECGTKCPLTCDNKDSPPPCVKMCVPGCFCEAGYVRDTNNKCIESSKCPKKICGENETFVANTTLCVEATCTKQQRYCGLGKQAKCLCNEGYIRDENNKCIKKSDCPV
ncbi:hypothetical protein PVAND_009014 [Polypedilum vanderplanki]|uniref:TIL domain-containing protein n=1 Tax=Polypedilum vanderplanki TaxID=319348 RepID=A0A9J6CBC7_POLVA|nr:hypothetical protein PVAND_009014 [Polypedilum vanderplanki]